MLRWILRERAFPIGDVGLVVGDGTPPTDEQDPFLPVSPTFADRCTGCGTEQLTQAMRLRGTCGPCHLRQFRNSA